jgi:hypothetical protein
VTDLRPGTPRVRVDSRTGVSTTAGGWSGRVMERGRSKAYRPLPTEVRTSAVERGLAAYGRGAWYLAHEELEPAWMGTDDPAERALLSGLIKLAAAYVHAARGNVLGVRTNLRGARERLRKAAASASAAEGAFGAAGWVDLDVLLDDLEDRLARIEALCVVAPGGGPGPARGSSFGIAPAGPGVAPGSTPSGIGHNRGALPAPRGTETVPPAVPPSHDVAGPSGRFCRAPIAVAPVPLPRRLG